MKPLLTVAALMGAFVLGVGLWWMGQGDPSARLAEVKTPPLSPEATAGKALFDANCARCHGENAAGGENGPPFLDRIYRPAHHADMAFQLAVMQGVSAHHWRYGNMPPVPDVSQDEVKLIVAYVREMQRANGIE